MVSVKSYAKLNITLKITGKNQNYHSLDSLVTSVDKFDEITAKKRKDDKIIITFVGRYGFTPKCQAQTNAYKSAKLFMDTFNVSGVDITIKRNIKTGGGMGGSSADIAGVLYAMKKLFKISCDLKPLADSLGSDSGYLLSGGFARISNRGEVVKKLDIDQKYYFVVIYANGGVNTKECFDLFDQKFIGFSDISCDEAENYLKSGDLTALSKVSGNDLYMPAIILNPEIKENLQALKSLSPEYACMTGSGSTCFAMYKEYEMASWAHAKLKKTYGDRVEILSSFNPNKLTFFDKLFNSYPSEDN